MDILAQEWKILIFLGAPQGRPKTVFWLGGGAPDAWLREIDFGSYHTPDRWNEKNPQITVSFKRNGTTLNFISASPTVKLETNLFRSQTCASGTPILQSSRQSIWSRRLENRNFGNFRSDFGALEVPKHIEIDPKWTPIIISAPQTARKRRKSTF